MKTLKDIDEKALSLGWSSHNFLRDFDYRKDDWEITYNPEADRGDAVIDVKLDDDSVVQVTVPEDASFVSVALDRFDFLEILDTIIVQIDEIVRQKKQKEEEKSLEFGSLRVNDIIVCSWGYIWIVTGQVNRNTLTIKKMQDSQSRDITRDQYATDGWKQTGYKVTDWKGIV